MKIENLYVKKIIETETRDTEGSITTYKAVLQEEDGDMTIVIKDTEEISLVEGEKGIVVDVKSM